MEIGAGQEGRCKSILEHATRGENKVLYKHQLELEERKEKALDKHLNFPLGQTERYSTMFVENLVNKSDSFKQAPVDSGIEQTCILGEVSFQGAKSGGELEFAQAKNQALQEAGAIVPTSYEALETSIKETFKKLVDDERTIDEDEASITEAEWKEELAANMEPSKRIKAC